MISEQLVLAAMFYFQQGFVFCRLIDKKVLEWFLLIMCEEPTLSTSTNLLHRNHPTLFSIKKRRSADVQYVPTAFKPELSTQFGPYAVF